jgi:pyruvate,water dikinase
MSEETFEMRRIFLALAGYLVAQGDLGKREDIFYLTCAELRQVVAQTLSAAETRRLIAERRAEIETDAQIELPDTICGEYVPAQTAIQSDTQGYLVGICGSSGIAQGQARVVHDPAEAPINLRPRDILVVPFTDVGWTPLFSGIGGIVAETGGQLSHTSIVAREYGLPAVVSVRRAMRLIAEGQTITVDGNRGRVYLEQAPEPEGG